MFRAKTLIYIAICIVFFQSCATEEPEKPQSLKDLEFYYRLADLSTLGVTGRLWIPNTVDEIQDLAQQLSYMAFNYWLETRLGNLEPAFGSRFRNLYKNNFEPLKEIKKTTIFTDPLNWLDTDDPQFPLPEIISDISKSEYEEILSLYHEFLYIVPDRKVPFSGVIGVGPEQVF